MLLIFLIINVVLAGCLLFVEITFNKLTLTPAFLKMFGFLIISFILSFLINHYVNPHQSFQAPKNESNTDNKNSESKIDEENTNPSILKALQNSAQNTASSFNNAMLDEENFFSANKNMFSFLDLFQQLFKQNN